MDRTKCAAIAMFTMIAGLFLGFGGSLVNDAWLYGQVLGTDAGSKAWRYGTVLALLGVAVLIFAFVALHRDRTLNPEH